MGRKRKHDSKDKFLPPCRVCQGPAGGFHYGVNTCEACKGFFHRSSIGKEQLECETDGNCPISHTIPRMCKKCRYAKCIAVGMAKQASKTGRYSSDRHTKYILEVKTLRKKRPVSSENPVKTPTRRSESECSDFSEGKQWEENNNNPSDRLTCQSPTSNQQYPSFHDLGPKLCTCSHNASMTCSESPTQTCSIQDDHLSPTITENSTESSPCQSVSFMKTLDDEGSDISNETCSSSSSRVCPCSPCPIDIRELYSDTDRVVETLVQAREDHVIHLLPKVSMKEIQKMATDHKESCRLRQEMFGSLTRLSDQDYDSIYSSTGLDADGRRRKSALYVSQMETFIRSYVKFAKRVPGFKLLQRQHQTTLIRYSRTEFLIFMGIQGYYGDVMLYGDSRMHCKRCTELAGTEFQSVMESLSHHCDAVSNLNLVTEERVVLTAIALMAPDRDNSVLSETVLLIYELLNECLIKLLNKRFEKPLNAYAKIMNIMVAFRTTNYDIKKVLKSLRIDKYTEISPLLREIYGGVFFDDLS